MKVLLLAGTREARELAGRCDLPGVTLIASLAGVTGDPLGYACATRVGGFGGGEGLAEWLAREGIAAVIDATHPFARRISANAAEAAARLGIPRLMLRRPAWRPEGGWTEYASLDALAAALPGGATVLLTTGRKDTAPFAARPDIRFILRSIEDAGPLPAHIETLRACPPFSRESETALMRRRGVTHLVTRNAGGARPAKLDAAASLGIPVLSVAMPPPPDGPVAETVADAIRWLRTL